MISVHCTEELAQLRLDLVLFVLDERERRSVRPNDDPGDDVAEHHGLLQAVTDDSHQTGHNHHDGQIL